MATRKAIKAVGESIEKTVDTDDVSRSKKKKISAKNAAEEGEEMRQIRLPRAAKATKTQENEGKDARADGEMNKKSAARSNVANSKKAPLAAKQTKAASKRNKIEAESPLDAEDAKDDVEVPTKKSRARGPAKKAGMIAGDDPEPKQKGKAKKNAATNNSKHDAAPPMKRGRGITKAESLDKEEEDEKQEEPKSPAQRKGKAQKKPAKAVAKKVRGKKETATKGTATDKMDSEKSENDDDASESIENGDKENDGAKLETTESAPTARKGKIVRKKADSTVNKKVTKSRAGKAAAAAAASGDSSEGNVEEPTVTKPVKGRQKKIVKDAAAATVGRKMQKKKGATKQDEDLENDGESEDTAEEKEDLMVTQAMKENLNLSSENSENDIQESENDDLKITEDDSIGANSPLSVKDGNE